MILALLIVVLIIWGPGRLPEVGAGLGRAYREFRKAVSDHADTPTTTVDSTPTTKV
jgi:sec-independent protein translocase protein TatA